MSDEMAMPQLDCASIRHIYIFLMLNISFLHYRLRPAFPNRVEIRLALA
jgi:hypothetical protein